MSLQIVPLELLEEIAADGDDVSPEPEPTSTKATPANGAAHGPGPVTGDLDRVASSSPPATTRARLSPAPRARTGRRAVSYAGAPSAWSKSSA
jgi:hypothetical protein